MGDGKEQIEQEKSRLSGWVRPYWRWSTFS